MKNYKHFRSEENECAWHYLKRNSVPKQFYHNNDNRGNNIGEGGSSRIMGIENIDGELCTF